MPAPSLAQFAAEHSLDLTRFAYLLCGDHQRAEDLVQDTFLALHRRFGDTLAVDRPLAYARKVIANANISMARRRSSTELVTDAVPDTPAVPTPTGAAWQALDGLGERQRAVLVMRYWLDLPDDEIAAVLGCRRGTVRSLAARAFAELRDSDAIKELS